MPHDSAGAPGVVARLHDDGLEVRTDDGGTLRLRHHDMAGHGDVLAADPRVFVQLRWGYLCTGRLGITVVTARRLEALPSAPRLAARASRWTTTPTRTGLEANDAVPRRRR